MNSITLSATANESIRQSGERTANGVMPGLRTSTILLRTTFTAVPIVAGLDKFTNLLANWENYLNPIVTKVLPISAHLFMNIVGVIEIVAGILVFARPRIGGLVVSAWLVGIALNLITSGQYLDVAVRDLVMAVGAFTLSTIAPVEGAPAGARS